MSKTLVLAGCGKMGEAMLSGWLERGMTPSDITIVEPNEETAGNQSLHENIALKNKKDTIKHKVRQAQDFQEI